MNQHIPLLRIKTSIDKNSNKCSCNLQMTILVKKLKPDKFQTKVMKNNKGLHKFQTKRSNPLFHRHEAPN